jgi:polyisoprenoid-binding protein YceI
VELSMAVFSSRSSSKNRLVRDALLVSAFAALAGGAAVAATPGFARTAAPAEAVFRGAVTGGLKLEGKTSELTVKSDDKAFVVVVGLKSLTTGIALRDGHMRDKYLEVEKYPETKLEVPVANLKVPAPGSSIESETKGQLTLHGQTKEVPFKYKATCKPDNTCDASGTAAININDFGIVVPKYLGVTMKPDVTLETAFQVKR